MELFSRLKKEKNKEQNSNSEVPATFPETAIDKFNNKPVKTPSKKIEFPERNKKIPQEILDKNKNSRTRIGPEIRYIKNEGLAQNNAQSVIQKEVSQNIAQEPKQEIQQQENVKSVAQSIKLAQKASEPMRNDSKFVDELRKLIELKRREINEIDSKDLVHKLKEYHESLKTGHSFFIHHSDVDNKLEQKIQEVKNMEDDWLELKRILDSAENVLLKKEIMLEKKFDELKEIISSGEKFKLFNTKCPADKAFVLANGQKIFSIQELLYTLPHMSDDVFYHHVTSERNDFANWIRDVFDDVVLANHIADSTKKVDFIRKMKDF